MAADKDGNHSANNMEDLQLDADDIIISAFETQDAFKPKLYLREKAFGKKKSFLCYREFIANDFLESSKSNI